MKHLLWISLLLSGGALAEGTDGVSSIASVITGTVSQMDGIKVGIIAILSALLTIAFVVFIYQKISK